MTGTRDRIERHVRSHPGVHFNALVRRLDLATGQVQYHLRRLCAAGDVVEIERYGRTHYFPPTYGEWERRTLALLRRETSRDVVLTLLDGGAERPQRIADDLGLARSTLEWHLDRLVAEEIVAKRRGEKRRVTLELTRPDETASLVADVAPSLPERMVDRFERLLDSLLSE